MQLKKREKDQGIVIATVDSVLRTVELIPHGEGLHLPLLPDVGQKFVPHCD